MLILPFVRYGIWTNKDKGHLLVLRYFGSEVCHGSKCQVCRGKKYLRKDGTMNGGKVYIFKVVNSFDARRVICPKCANEYLWRIKSNMDIRLVDTHNTK